MYHVVHLLFFFFCLFCQNEKGLLNFVSERIKLVYRINNTRYNFQKNKLPFKHLKPTIYRPHTFDLKSISKYQSLFHWNSFENIWFFVGNGVEPTPYSIKTVIIVMWYDCIRKLKGHTRMTMRKGKVFLKNTKQNWTEQDNPCLWFLFYFYFAFHNNLVVTFRRPCQDLSMWGFIRLYTFAKDVYMC